MHQAFVASATLKPMARQLLQDRNPQAYAGVESFARKHSADDAGSLAWLAVGYAHFLDHDYPKAIDPLSRAKPHAGDIGDYVAYYLAASYLQSGRTPEAVASKMRLLYWRKTAIPSAPISNWSSAAPMPPLEIVRKRSAYFAICTSACH
jgi:hypothetical protein